MAEELARIKNVKDTTKNWEVLNPVLLDGEIGFELKTNGEIAMKIGDGFTKWKQLEYHTMTKNEIAAIEMSLSKSLGESETYLQNQINNIALVASDSGDVTAEVAQARVGLDGTNHDILKARLDSMEKDTQSVIDNVESFGELSLDWKVGYISNTGVPRSYDGWKYASFPVKLGEKYYMWSSTSADAYPYAMKDVNGNIVEIGTQGTLRGFEYTVPCNGTLYVCGWGGATIKGNTHTNIPDTVEKVNTICDTLSLNRYDWTSGKYYDSNCSLQTAAQCSYMQVKVMQGEKYCLNISGTMAVYPLFLKGVNGDIVDSLSQGTYTDYIYEVPVNGTLYISTFTADRYFVKKYAETSFTAKDDYLSGITNEKNMVICYGDSLTQGNQDGTGNTYPNYLKSAIDDPYTVTVLNRGSGGDTSAEIASRQGGFGLIVAPFTIPADTTAVEVFFSCGARDLTYFFPARQNISALGNVSINGIKGKLTYSGSASSISGEHHYYFTRSEAGESVEITRPTLVETTGYNSRYDTQIIWAGTNDKPTLEKLKENVIPTIDNMIKFLHTDRYLVVGLTSKSYMPEIADVNDYMRKYYGSKFVNIRDYILEYGLEDAGITATEQDLTDIANGEMPSSLRTDDVHFNRYGYQIVAQRIYEQGKVLGYW